MKYRIIAAGLAALTIFAISSLSISSPAAVRGCWTNKQCPRGFYCQPGINPKVRGICVLKPANTPCYEQKDCRRGYHCTGILIPRKAGLCTRNQ